MRGTPLRQLRRPVDTQIMLCYSSRRLVKNRIDKVGMEADHILKNCYLKIICRDVPCLLLSLLPLFVCFLVLHHLSICNFYTALYIICVGTHEIVISTLLSLPFQLICCLIPFATSNKYNKHNHSGFVFNLQ